MIEYIDLTIDFAKRNDRLNGMTLDRVTTRSYDTAIKFRIEIVGHVLDETYDVKILSKYSYNQLQALYKIGDNLEFLDGKLIYTPKVDLISQADYVRNYLYLSKDGLGLDMAQFNYEVDLSEIDKTALKVKEVYDQSYSDLLENFEQALTDYKDTLPQASDLRAEIDVLLNNFGVDSQAKLNQYDDDAQQVIADNQTAFGLAETGRQNNYEQAEDNRNQASSQAVADWKQGANSLLETVEDNESARVDDEATRKTAETDRVSSETTRKTNETTRISNELDRQQAELDRQAQEEARETAEGERETSEVQRKADHANRSAEFDGKADKVVLKNLVPADYPASPNLVTSTILNSDTGERELTISSLSSVNGIYQDIGGSHINDILYVYAEYLTKGMGAIQLGPSSIPKLDNKGIGEYYKYSAVYTAINRNIFFYHDTTHGNSYEVGDTFNINKRMVINLTQTFGAGNEPTKEEMDELIETVGYIDEEYILNNKEMLAYSMNSIGQKANSEQEEWIIPTLLNGVTGEVRYRINAFNQLELAGAISIPTDLSSSNPVFEFVRGVYIPNRTTQTDTLFLYTGRRMKLRIPIDGNGTVFASISGYNNSFYVGTDSQGETLHINLVISLF